MPTVPKSALPHGLQAVLISPDRSVGAELSPLLAQQLPHVQVSHLQAYPSRLTAADVVPQQGSVLCFLDLGSESERGLSLIAELQAFDPGIVIVVLLPEDEPDLILRSLRQGASEFMLRPFTADQLQVIAEKLSKLNPDLRMGRDGLGKVICVIPAKGACGATTVACSLAFHYRRLGAKKVLLADLDPLTGTVAFLLKLKSSYSFVDALTHASTLDGDLWKVMTSRAQGIDVLLSPENPADGMQEARDATSIVEYARRIYDAVVIDTSGPFSEFSLSVARMADTVLLVTTNELPSLQAAQRATNHLERNNVDRTSLRLVVNRFSREVGLTQDAIQTALKMDAYHVIPSDYDAVQRSLMEGKSIPPGSGLGKSLAQLAEKLNGKERKTARTSSVGGLLSIFSRT